MKLERTNFQDIPHLTDGVRLVLSETDVLSLADEVLKCGDEASELFKTIDGTFVAVKTETDETHYGYERAQQPHGLLRDRNDLRARIAARLATLNLPEATQTDVVTPERGFVVFERNPVT